MRNLLLTAAAAAVLAAPAFAGDQAAKVDHHASMQGDIVETAINAGSFTTLVAAIQAAGLVETLQGEGPFTVFAPTDEAFAALGEDTIDTLLQPENRDQLVAILTYHVVPGEYFAGDLAGQSLSVASVQGDTIDIDATGDAVLIDGATVVSADVDASNGVIHVINQVIMPD